VVEYIPLPSSPLQQRRDGYVHAPSRVNHDNYHSNRSAPMPVSRRPSREEDVIPSIERDQEPTAPARTTDNNQHARRYDDGLAPVGHYSMRQANPQPPPLPAAFNGIRDDYYEQVPRRLKPVHYEGAAPSKSSQSSIFDRMHSRHATETQSRPRVPNSHVVDLTSSSPLRPSASDREVYAAPHVSAGSTARSYASHPLREYVNYGPGYRGAEQHALRRHETVVGPRETYVRMR
jgi:hypothetical protein